MKKVIYSITKYGKEELKLKGLGYLVDDKLLVPAVSKSGKNYIRIFENVFDFCNPVPNAKDEFKGILTEYRTIEVERFTSSGASTGFEDKEIETSYYMWFKYAKEGEN